MIACQTTQKTSQKSYSRVWSTVEYLWPKL